jgi:hypothetical protein
MNQRIFAGRITVLISCAKRRPYKAKILAKILSFGGYSDTPANQAASAHGPICRLALAVPAGAKRTAS